MYFSLHIILMLLKSSLIIPMVDCLRMFQRLRQNLRLIIPNTKMFSIMLKGFITEINYFNCFHLNNL